MICTMWSRPSCHSNSGALLCFSVVSTICIGAPPFRDEVGYRRAWHPARPLPRPVLAGPQLERLRRRIHIHALLDGRAAGAAACAIAASESDKVMPAAAATGAVRRKLRREVFFAMRK